MGHTFAGPGGAVGETVREHDDGDPRHALLAAREVQQRLLPALPALPTGYQMAGAYEPAAEVGGDLLDWALDDAGVLHLAIGDVMGKGLGAALLAAAVRAAVRAAAGLHDLQQAFARTVRVVHADLEATSSFVTLLAVRVDLPTGRVSYLDSGHGLGAVFGAGGPIRPLVVGDPPLGLWPDHPRRVRTEVLAPGETLLVASDGLLAGLADRPDDCALQAAAEVCRRVEEPAKAVEELVRLACGSPRTRPDDATVAVLRREPA